MIRYLTARNPALREQQLRKRNRMRKIAKIKTIFAYILILFIVVASHYIVLVIFANSDADEARNWATNYLMSLGQDMGVSQMFKVLLTIVCLRMMINVKGSKLKKLLRHLVDPVTVRAMAMVVMLKN